MQQLSCTVSDDVAFVFQELAKNSKRSISNLLGMVVEEIVSKATPEVKTNAQRTYHDQLEAALGFDADDLEAAPWAGSVDGGR